MTETLIHGLDNLPGAARGCVLTIGNFDGVHIGHQDILRAGRARADEAGAKLVAMTFDPPPISVLAPDLTPQRIVPPAEKVRLLTDYGADLVVVTPATKELLSMTPEAFVDEVLVARFAPVVMVEGPNFHFGKDRSGNVDVLRKLSDGAGFEVIQVGPVRLDLPGRGETHISSSLIRKLIAAGDVETAGLCLGRPYTLRGKVVTGEQRGRSLEFPTANIEPSGVMSPADGIYAARAELDGVEHVAAVSIGVKPTFGPAPRTIEVHLLDVSGDFYGKEIGVSFVARLRDQETFADAEALRARIKEDLTRVRDLCG